VNDNDYTNENDENDENEQSDISISFGDDNDLSLSGEWILIDWCETDTDSSNKDDEVAMRLSCFAHSLQLAIRDGLRNTPYLSKSLSKCIKLARRSHKSTKIADLLDDIGKSINRSNVTRWSSEYLLIKSILALGKKTIDEITNVIDDNEIRFNNNDFIVLQEAIEILEPFAEITSRIQSESVVTASLVVPSVVHMMEHIKIIKPNVSFLKKMCVQLEESINRRFAGIVKRLSQQIVLTSDPFSDPIYFICAVLDPEFKFYWLNQMNYKPTSESQMKQTLIHMILDECERNIDTSLDNTLPIQSSLLSTSVRNSHATQSIGTSIIKKRKLFQYDNDDRNLSVDPPINPMNEIDAYINDPMRTKFSSYWKNSQLFSLKNVVKRVFSIQASSAPIERAFSQAGVIMSPRRTSMREEVFRNLVFLRVNQNLI
jgi:hypothetical protein